MDGPVALLFGLVALYIALWLFILLPARMASARGRSAVFWVLVSLVFSPFLAIFFLWVLGGAGHRNP